MTKTIIGNNNFLFLKSEVEQHFLNNLECDNSIHINKYIDNLKKNSNFFFMFIVPDKSIICKNNLPNNINKSKIFRYANLLNNNNIIDLNNYLNLNETHYFKSDTHINCFGSLMIAEQIVKQLCNSTFDISDKLNYLNNQNFFGDLMCEENIGKNKSIIKAVPIFFK